MADALDPIQTFADILAEHGPLPEDDVVRRLQAAGVADPEDVLDELIDESGCAASQLTDERWVWLPTLLDGRVFTHRLSASELAHDMLTVTPDLDPVTTLCESERCGRFADGSPARVALPMFDIELLDEREIPLDLVDPLGALLLTSGTLASVGAVEGGLVGVRLTPEGLAIEPVTTIADAAVGAQFAAMLDADEPAFFDAVVWTACVDDPALFTQPLAPLREIADAAGLPYDQEWLAPAGFDFDVWRFDLGCARLARRYELDPDDAFALYTLLELSDRMSLLIETADSEEPLDDSSPTADQESDVDEGPSLAELTGELGAVLADPMLAEILMTETLDRGRIGAAALGLFAETLEPKVPRAARVACRWLRAVALERTGSVEEAEQALLAAESMDTDWAPALFDLARFAADRGDAERGLSLLRRAGAGPDDPMVRLLEQHRATPRTDLGRNDACWCGSGRKYKKCHLGREQLPLSERVGWLYTKAAQHVVVNGWTDLLAEVELERLRYVDDDDEADADPLPLDAVLFEGGAFENFLDVRGALLPEDERALAEQWLLTDRSVFEVDEVQRGHSVTVRDVRTGDRHVVRERTASGFLKPGQLICTRVLPAGDTMQFFGGLEPVALHERDALIALLDAEPDPVELVAYLSRRFAPPTLVNTEGDPLAICEATVRVGDPHSIEAALDETYERLDGEEPPRWLEHIVVQGMPRIRATLVLDGDTLRVETNSENRMDSVLATLARVDLAMTVLDDTRQPMRDTREAAALAKQLPSGGGTALDPDDPEVAAFLGEVIRNYETSWLDESIPALDGHTPRQAADDPTRRADLIKLLDTFPAGEAARGGMDADRLRAALGL
ncbi:MAG TPA: SEC-C domain-containing protein [Mycobacterium sp.]|nr:SEC-C domain-containing protein [Mycobacterium sp.]